MTKPPYGSHSGSHHEKRCVLLKLPRGLRCVVRVDIRRSCKQKPGCWRQRPLDEGRVRERIRMRPDRDVIVLADDVDGLVRCMRDHVHLRKPEQEICYDVTHRKLHRRNTGGASHGAGWFAQSMADGCLGVFRLAQHCYSVAIELLAG